MVRSVVIEDSLRNDLEHLSNDSCSIVVGTVQDEKRFVLAIYHVPVVNDVVKNTEDAVNSLLFALPGGCYPLGVIANTREFALSNIVKKVMSKLTIYVRIEERVSETLLLHRSGNTFDGKILVNGQLKPITVKYMSFLSQWNEIRTYTRVVHYIDSSKDWKTNILSYINVLQHSHLLLGGHQLKSDNEFLNDSRKNSQGKVLHPKLLLPLISEQENASSCCYGEVYSHLWVHFKMTIEQTKAIILEDIIKSFLSRMDVFCQLDESHYYNTRLKNDDIKLPYRVTFPLGIVELSVYLLHNESLSHATEIVKDMFDLYPTNLKAQEEVEVHQSLDDVVEEEDEACSDKIKNVILGALGGILALLVAILFLSETYQ